MQKISSRHDIHEQNNLLHKFKVTECNEIFLYFIFYAYSLDSTGTFSTSLTKCDWGIISVKTG